MIDLSFIIPLYNAQEFIGRCVASCANQGLDGRCEIIVVNDGSTDSSLATAEALKAQYPMLKVLSQENGGVSKARNLGISHAAGRYVCFIDSDDYVQANTFKKTLDESIENNLDICFYKMKVQKADGSFCDSYTHSFEYSHTYTGGQLLQQGFQIGSSCIALYRRDFIMGNSIRFREGMRYSEDSLFVATAVTLAQKVRFMDVTSYIYIYNDASATKKNAGAINEAKVFNNITMAQSLLELSRNHTIAPAVKDNLTKRANSITCGQILALLKAKHLRLTLEYIKRSTAAGVLPMRGPTLSPLTTILKPPINLAARIAGPTKYSERE